MADDFLCSIWSSRLTPNVQAIIAGPSEGDLSDAAHIIEVLSQTIFACVALLPNNALQQHIEDLSRQVAALSSQLAHHHSSSRK
jgi:hypothetical protein